MKMNKILIILAMFLLCFTIVSADQTNTTVNFYMENNSDSLVITWGSDLMVLNVATNDSIDTSIEVLQTYVCEMNCSYDYLNRTDFVDSMNASVQSKFDNFTEHYFNYTECFTQRYEDINVMNESLQTCLDAYEVVDYKFDTCNETKADYKKVADKEENTTLWLASLIIILILMNLFQFAKAKGWIMNARTVVQKKKGL